MLDSNVFRFGDRAPTDWRSEAMANYAGHSAADAAAAQLGGAGALVPRDIPDYKGAAEFQKRSFLKLGYEAGPKPSTHRETLPRHAARAYAEREPPCDPSARAAGGGPSRATMGVVLPDGTLRVVPRVASGLDLGHDAASLTHATDTRDAAAGMTAALAALVAAGGSARPGEDGQRAAKLAKEDHLNVWKSDFPEVRRKRGAQLLTRAHTARSFFLPRAPPFQMDYTSTQSAAALKLVADHAALTRAGGSARPSGADGAAASQLAKEDHIVWAHDDPAPRFDTTHRATLPAYPARAYAERAPPCDPSAAGGGLTKSRALAVVAEDGALSSTTRVASGLDFGHAAPVFVTEAMRASGATAVALTRAGGFTRHLQPLEPRPFTRFYKGPHEALTEHASRAASRASSARPA